MHDIRRLMLGLGVAAMLAACGGTETDDLVDPDGSAEAAARGGKNGGGTPAPSGGASISATNAVYGGYTVVSFYPGSYAGNQLYVGYKCTQNGATVLAASSWELHYAVSAGYVSYALLGDHYNVVFNSLRSQVYTGGSASCVVEGYVGGSKGLKSVASSTFTISG